MTREEIIRMALDAGFCHDINNGIYLCAPMHIERFAALVAFAENEECAKVCEEKQEYSMPISCPDGISGCLVAHYVPARREKTGSECAVAIRARKKNE